MYMPHTHTPRSDPGDEFIALIFFTLFLIQIKQILDKNNLSHTYINN